jgi:hypothetical protein
MSFIESKYIESLSIGSRSSKRTDLIHHGIGESVMDWFPDITYKIEQKMNTHIGTYKVDVVLYKNDKPILFILVKAPLCNIKQNETNTQNSCLGEIVKLYKSYPTIPIVMFDFMPIECPYYSKDNTIKKIEKFEIKDVRETSKLFKELTEIPGLKNPMLRDRFIVFTNLSQTSKDNLSFDSFEDKNDIERFQNFVKTLM